MNGSASCYSRWLNPQPGIPTGVCWAGCFPLRSLRYAYNVKHFQLHFKRRSLRNNHLWPTLASLQLHYYTTLSPLYEAWKGSWVGAHTWLNKCWIKKSMKGTFNNWPARISTSASKFFPSLSSFMEYGKWINAEQCHVQTPLPGTTD